MDEDTHGEIPEGYDRRAEELRQEERMQEKDIIICGHGSGRPSTKNMRDYLAGRYSQTAPNGKRQQLIEVRRLKTLTDQGRAACHELYRRLLGRNYYNQDLREYVFHPYENGKYYSDCSSSQMATLQTAGFNTGGLLNTAGIHDSDRFETVPVIIEKGHVKNPEILKVMDQLLFVGKDPKRPLQIGHVESIFEIPENWEPEVYPRWIYDAGRWYYREAEGQNAHGWRIINHHRYYFDEKGVMLKDWQLIGGKWYYFHPTAGAQYEGALYRSDADGAQNIWYIDQIDG